MGERIQIIEVGPRDGFQNLATYLPVDVKMNVIDKLVEAGVTYMQHTSFVHPKAIPQLKDAAELTTLCLEKYPQVTFNALVPNLHGAKAAWDLGLKDISYVASLSESHNKANINRTHDQSFDELQKIVTELPDMKIWFDIATTFGCPFEGMPKLEDLLAFIQRAYAMGLRRFGLADTIGIANPKQVREFTTACLEAYPDCDFHVHIHDTRNMGMLNTLAAVECGITKVQTTLGGLGGCPFAPGASGNTATEDLVYMLHEIGYETGIDFNKMVDGAKFEKSVISDGVFSGHHMNINTKPT